MNRFLLLVKAGAWKIAFFVIMLAAFGYFLYRIARPSENKSEFIELAQTKVTTAIKENEIRATLEKDKIGAIKKIYERKLKDTKKIQDRDERLKSLIRLHDELDL